MNAGVVLLAALVMLTGVSLAWYGELRKIEFDIDGSVTYVARYFESGNGTTSDKFTDQTSPSEDDRWGDYAYEIATPEQLYNLAWLQYMGYFNDKKVYFYLSADLNMEGYVLPPIGTAKYPFVGEFDGNGKTISNLTVSNSLTYSYTKDGRTYYPMQYGSGDEKSEMPLQAYEELGKTDSGEKKDIADVEIIGLFGVVGSYAGGSTYENAAASISNLKITGISIVGRTTNCLAGLAAGYVNGGIDGVTVTGSIDGTATTGGVDLRTSTSESENNSTKLSYYTTVGYCVAPDTVNVAHSVSVKSVDFEKSDESSEFGGTIDMKSLYQRLVNVYGKSGYASKYPTVTTTYERSTPDVVFSQTGQTTSGSGTSSESEKYGFKNYSEEDTSDSSDDSNASDKKYYATYSFSSTSKATSTTDTSSDGVMYLFGADNSNSASGTTNKVSTYTTNGYSLFTIKQSVKTGDDQTTDFYLNKSGSSIVAGSDPETAALWSYVSHDHVAGGNSYLVTMTVTTASDGTKTYTPHYLTISGTTLTVVDDYTKASAWTRETVGDGYAYSSGGAYLYYDKASGAWTVVKSDQIINIQTSCNVLINDSSAYHYLYGVYDGKWEIAEYKKEQSSNYTGALGNENSAEAAKWHVKDAGNDKVYLSVTATVDTAKGAETRYLSVANGSLTLVDSESAASKWTISQIKDSDGDPVYVSKSPLCDFTTESGGKTYYLNFTWYTTSLVNYRKWTVATSTTEDATKANRAGNTVRLVEKFLSAGDDVDTSLYKCDQAYSSDKIPYVYTVTENNAASTYITNDTVLPISINETVGTSYPSTTGYTTRTQPGTDSSGKKYYANTGYIVSGAELSSTPQGNIRVSKYKMSGISVAVNDTSSTMTYSSATDQKLEILTQTAVTSATTKKLGRITDSNTKYNTTHPNTSSTIKDAYDAGSLTDLGLNSEVYNLGRDELSSMLMNSGWIYGLHFMNAAVSKTNVATFSNVYINGIKHEKYQMPRNCIDFELNSTGYITFFAGTYYSGNTSFFSLHHIYRNETGEITDIKEISKIYSLNGSYIYEYKDGSYAAYTNGSYTETSAPTGAKLAFDLSWLTSPDPFVSNAVYYFQIPANKGEYALGSTSGHGAYLFYLDICCNPDAGKDKYTCTESLETVSSGISGCPDGVGFETVKDAAVSLPFEAAAAKVTASTEDGKSTITLTQSDGSSAVSYDARCVYAASGVDVKNGTVSMSVDQQNSNKYIRTITEYAEDAQLTQVDEVNATVAEDGTFTVDSVIKNLVKPDGSFTEVPEDKSDSWEWKLKNDTIVTYDYQITAGKSGTVDIDPRFTYNKNYGEDTSDAGSSKDTTSKGTDMITVTSTDEEITLRNFDVRDYYTVQIKTGDSGTTTTIDSSVSSITTGT